jgi:tetratricopeptide (TPR) repeat protein
MKIASKAAKRFLFIFFFPVFAAANFSETISAEIPQAALNTMPPMRQIYHPVSTTNAAAQNSFDRGLTYIFAFNHDIAYKEFEKAAQLDPHLAMAYWGMALARGQNINKDVTPENEIKCYEFSQKALKLSSGASACEQAYIKALATRYTNDPSADLIPLRFKYRDAMKKVAAEYFEDLDAASLYAESILDLDPWRYWTWDGKPKEGTYEAIDVLESVLRRNPNHLGANHYIIHAWEGSPMPERALMSAYRLTTLLPESGHLLHMPCHIFTLVGDYDEAIKTDKNAIAADRQYIQQNGMSGDYPLHYLSHNIYVLARCYMLSEDYNNAIKTAFEFIQLLQPHLEKMPEMGSHVIVPLEIYLYFHRWKELLAYKLPSNKSPYAQAYWHFSRAVAYANLGDLDSAKQEEALMQQARQHITDSEMIAQNPATRVFHIAELVLNAALASSQKHPSESIEYLTKAVEAQDRLDYDEPPAWYIPIRVQLGKALLQQERYPEAQDVFEAALKQLQRNGRLLFGLTLSLKGQSLDWNAFWTQREMTAALKHAPRPLTLDDL